MQPGQTRSSPSMGSAGIRSTCESCEKSTSTSAASGEDVPKGEDDQILARQVACRIPDLKPTRSQGNTSGSLLLNCSESRVCNLRWVTDLTRPVTFIFCLGLGCKPDQVPWVYLLNTFARGVMIHIAFYAPNIFTSGHRSRLRG